MIHRVARSILSRTGRRKERVEAGFALFNIGNGLPCFLPSQTLSHGNSLDHSSIVSKAQNAPRDED